MAKFFGKIGYAEEAETRPGVWNKATITERSARGDILRNQQRSESEEKVNDDIVLKSQISIIADAYAMAHFFAIRYVKWSGVYWKVTSVDVQHPRLLLTIGGVYHGETARTA